MKRNEAKTRIKEKRVSSGMTQETLASKAGINKRSYERIEQGDRPIDSCHLDTILRVCLALDCEIGEILEDPTLWEKYLAQNLARESK